ncbi:DUF5694 domain-containing protein [Aureibacter tunicatorum]|uniref:Uncharacterized protein YnzC (UPF0291/DUF896 family) n=1 Tax=Aureibacter tunicatorum TaxID=866807 RepID=A0AAE3XP40_9BACT|nr:DUF5694 domain-containing protein [Aureibacter tunicatorum]MDR6239528.1 uncharacterized protein YnzC (UPF0291/DUF896 family) [Aureibacter tunicatorum]BDD04005.1 hypothetical protein AUTU_14880 [Aureibacter tunicatorum]
MKNALLIIALLFGMLTAQAQDNKIKVLNLGVFHMGYTSDAHSIEYDESSDESKKQIKEVNELIARFKPTHIMVEVETNDQNALEEAYLSYLKDPKQETTFGGTEVEILAFEIGRLANTAHIHAIDHSMAYNYNLGELAQETKADKFFQTLKTLEKSELIAKLNPAQSGLKETLSVMNSESCMNFLINANADMLTYINSDDKFEGADEAAKLYHRNLRMYANINKIKTNEEDRILIISGGLHASFFHQFMSRSSVYELESVEKYLSPENNL